MKKINLFSRLWSSGGNSQSTDVGYDSRSTVGSPSGLKSSTLLKFVSVLVLILTIGIGQMWGANAPVNTVLWGENFAHFGTKTPSSAGTGSGTTIYDGASISYAQSSSNTKGYNENLAGGTAPELLLYKSNTTWTISNIKTGGATGMSLTFLSNKTTFSVTVSGTTNLEVTGSGKSWTISLKSGKTDPGTFNLVIKNTGSSNARIDNVVLKVTTAGGGGTPTHTLSSDVSPSGTGSVDLSATTVAEGSTATATATPNSGYKFSSWSISGTGASLSSTSTNPTTVTMGTANATVTANFVSKGCTDHNGTNVVSGASTSHEYGPIDPYYEYSTRQILYTKTDLGLAAGKKGTIKGISFQYAYTSALTGTNSVKIYMANTSLTELSTSKYVTSFTEVYSGSYNCSGNDVYNEITLDTPFEYDGIGNLVVIIDDNSNKEESSSCVFKYHTANTTTGAQIYTRAASTNADPTAAATWTGATTVNYRPNTKFCIQEADMVPATVTLKDNDATLTEASAGAGVTLPSRAGCSGYTFAGWTKTWVAPQSSWTTTAPTIIPAGSYTPSANENLYPVYTKTEGGEEEETEIFATTSLGSTNTVTTGYAVSATAEAKSGYYQDGSGTTRSVSVSKSSTATAMISSIPTIATVTATLGGGTTKDPLTNNVYAVWLDASGNELGDAVQITSKITNTTGSDFTANLPVANATSAYGVRIKHQKETSYNVRYYAISLSITTGGSTTYYISIPDCCTPLGSINGSFSFSNVSATSVTVGVPSDYSDKDNANLEGYIFKRYAAASGGLALETIETNSPSGTTATFNTSLAANTAYYYTIIAKHSSSSCNSEETSPRKSYTITSYTVSYAAGTGGTGTNPGAHAPVLSGTSIDLKDNTFTAPAGKEFAGWNDGSNDYDEGDSYTVTANKTMTAQWSCITPHISSQSISNANYLVGATPVTALSVTIDNGSYDYQWQSSSTENGEYSPVAGATSSSFTPPVSATSDLWYKCVITNTGSSCNTTATSNKAHIVVAAPSYRLWTGWGNGGDLSQPANTWDWVGGAYFVQVNSSNEWRITNYTIPNHVWTGSAQMVYNVEGKNTTNTKFYDLAFAVSQGTASVKKGPMPGAIGTLRMYDNSDQANGYLGFLPNNYMVRFGTHDYIMTETSSTVWETAIQTLDAADLTNVSQYRVGVTNSSDAFVAINENCPLTNVTSMGQKSNAGNSWGSNLAAGDAGKRGKFRIWLDYATYNWECHFVPYHRIVFDANYPVGAIGDEPADTYSVDVSVEETNSSIALASAPTAPAGYTFAGWFTDASGGTQRTGAQTISAGATADVTLYAHWTANANTAYTVKHYQQNIADDNYTLFATQNFTGTTDAEVTPAVNSYTGFTAPSTQTVTILGDGSRVVEYNYTRNSYNLTWNLGGGTTTSAGTGIESGVSVNTTSSVKYGTSLTAPTVTKTGYGFNAWSSAVAGTMPAAATTYTATWNATNYTITYNDLEGATNSNPANYTIESSAITLVDPGTRDGYTFAGWYTNSSKTTPAGSPAIAAGSTGNKTFWAKWDRNYYTITWHVGASTSTTEDVEHGTTFSTLEASAPAHADNALSECGSTKFIGWVKAGGVWTDDGKTADWYNTYKYAAADEITSDVDIYAMYAEASGSSTDYALYSGVLTEGDYVLVYATTGSALKNTVTSNRLDYEEPSIVTDVISSPAASIIWHIAQDGDYWTIYNDNVSKYAGGTTTKNQGALLSSVTDYAKWSCSSTAESTTYDFINKGRAGGASDTGNKYLRNNKSGNPATNYGFACYASGTGGALSLYKLSVSYINYRTGCSVSCAAPTSLTVGSTVTKTGATISWTGGGNGTLVRYEYAVWEDGTVEPTSDYISAGTSTSATLSGLYSGVKYNWKVRKVCTGDDNSRFASSSFTTTAADLTYSVPDGVSAVTTPATTAGDLNSAEVPTSCGSCWAFVGWTTDAISTPTSSAPATLFPAGTKARVSGDATLHAVYSKSKYRIVGGLSEIDADEYYVISFSQDGVTSAMANAVTETYYVTEEEMPIKEDNTGAYIESPDEDAIWKFTGTTSAGRFQNVGNDKYLDLSNSSNPPIASSTSDYVNITVYNSSNKMFDVESNTTDGNYLQLYNKGWGVDDDHSGYYSCRLFKRAGSSYTTVPDCRTFTVTWDVNNGATTSTSNVTKCDAYLASLPGDPANNTLDACIGSGKGRFVGWSPTKVMPAQDVVPTGMFSDVDYSPEITRDTTFYAVFAEVSAGGVAATSKTYTFTSASWGDDEGAWDSGAAGRELTSGRGVQITTSQTGANATTKSSYDDVTKVTVTYSTNASKGVGAIDIQVDGTSYTGSADVTKTGGTSDRTIDFTPPSSALDGNVKITVTCTENSIYIKSVQIFYTGSTITYSGYRTACCTDPQLKFLDGEGDPTTEYVIVREDLASASAGVTIGCNISSLNTTEDITWKQTKRIKTDYHTANTWNASQTDRCQIDITNHKISAYETGSWQITIEQLMGSTNYCDGTATVNILVKTIDKFIDAVNGNFSGEAQRLEDTGNGILLPTEATFSTNNGCADGTTRRLIGWIKASDLATYASGRRVNMIDDLKTGDASNKVIAPGTKVQATGVTWYAVWGVEK